MAALFRLVLAFCAACVLAACSTLGGPGPDAPFDPLIDDIASMVIAVDLPRGLGPAPGSIFTYDVANGGPTEHLRLTPIQANVDALPAGLPPPGIDRAYYLFAFSEPDKQAIRDAQITAQLGNATARSVTVGFIPKLCTAGFVDPNTATVSIYAAMPGRAARAFLNQMRLADLLRQPGSTQMGPCA